MHRSGLKEDLITMITKKMPLWVLLMLFCPTVAAEGGTLQTKKPPVEQKFRGTGELTARRKDIITEAEAHYQIGMAYLREPQNTGQAVEYLERAVVLNGRNAEYHFRLAEAHTADFPFAGLFRKPFIAAKVKNELELAVKYDPITPAYREGLIEYLVNARAIFGGSYAKAHEHATALVNTDPYLGTLARAGISAEEGELEKAEKLFKKAIIMRPASWAGYQRLGGFYMTVRRIGEAIVQFKKYITVSPDMADGYERIGQAFVRQRMYDEAIDAYRTAMQKDPSLASLLFRIAQLYEFKGSKREALRHYEQYLSVVPSGPIATDARLKIRELSGYN